MSVIDVLELPYEAQVNRVVPKKHFFTQADISGADKKRFDAVERVRWEYALKPESTNISAFHDETREYGEIEVLTVELRERKGVARLAEIMLRAMPYPLLLFFNHGDEWQLWMGQLRYSESEHGAMTVTEMQATEWLPETAELWRQMAFSNQRAADMYLLNVQRICAEKAEAAGKSEDWEAELRTMNLQGGDGSPGRNSAAEIKTPEVKTPEERIKEGGEGS